MNEQPYTYMETPLEPVVPFKQWLKLLAISLYSLIPFVGWIVMLVLYIIKASDHNQPASVRNYIKAGFIYCGVVFVITVIFVLIFVAAITSQQGFYGFAEGFTEGFSNGFNAWNY